MEDLKIIQQISTICDNLPAKMRKAKEHQRKTNQQIIDSTGLSESTVKKFFSGHLTGPSIYDVTAMAIDLGLSLDELMELSPSSIDNEAELERLQLELDHKNDLLAEKDRAIERLLDRSRIQEAGIATRDAQLRRQEEDMRRRDSAYKPLIYGLCGLCILLTIVWGIYVILDAKQLEVGLIRSNTVSPLIWIGAAAVVVLLVMLLHFTVSRWYRKTKDR